MGVLLTALGMDTGTASQGEAPTMEASCGHEKGLTENICTRRYRRSPSSRASWSVEGDGSGCAAGQAQHQCVGQVVALADAGQRGAGFADAAVVRAGVRALVEQAAHDGG